MPTIISSDGVSKGSGPAHAKRGQTPCVRVLKRALGLLGLVALFVWPTKASAQTSDNLLLVVNDASPASIQVGEYYARKRNVPPDHVVHLKAPITETIPRLVFETDIAAPIVTALTKGGLQDRVLYFVLAKGVPLRIAGTGGLQGTTASVDSELTLLYRRMIGAETPIAGRVDNPYFLADKPIGEAKAFTRLLSDIYLVTRLDGFTVEDVLKLIDRGVEPATAGTIVLDEKATIVDRGGDQWLEQAADRLRKSGAGDRVILEDTKALATSPGPVIGYYSWGSNDPSNHLRHFGLTFAPGAIGGMYLSTDGRTFTEPPPDWVPSAPAGGPAWMGSFQSLAGDLIRDGITGVAAHVSEPLLDATIRPQILFPAYLAGFNLAESFYLAMPFLSWQTIVIGDPLCAPFAHAVLAPDQIAHAIDPDTGLPAIFSERTVAILSAGGLNVDAVKMGLKGDAAARQHDMAAAEALWLQATEAEPRLGAIQAELANLYETHDAYDKAIDRYRKVLAVNQNDIVALNNLAYALAVRSNAPKDALPFAQKAFRLAPTPVVADTLGWVDHLLGDEYAAQSLLEHAVAASPGSAEMLFHAAVVNATLGQKTRAKQELDSAEKLDPQLSSRADVKALRAIIGSD
jgi:uncharacterized protein (TIGR03790 family)